MITRQECEGKYGKAVIEGKKESVFGTSMNVFTVNITLTEGQTAEARLTNEGRVVKLVRAILSGKKHIKELKQESVS